MSLKLLPDGDAGGKPRFRSTNTASLTMQPTGSLTPTCSRHGAMNRVSGDVDWWRCVAPDCGIGVEWLRSTT